MSHKLVILLLLATLFLSACQTMADSGATCRAQGTGLNARLISLLPINAHCSGHFFCTRLSSSPTDSPKRTDRVFDKAQLSAILYTAT